MNFEYYDQLIEYYCPGVLAYIHDKNIDIEQGLLATLLKLERKNKLTIKQDKIEILEKEYSNITHMEEYMMRSVEYGFLSMKVNKLEEGYREEALKSELFTEEGFKIKAETATALIFTMLFGLSLMSVENYILSFIGMIAILLTVIIGCVVRMAYTGIGPSNHGKSICNKLKKLKKYMKKHEDNEILKKWKNYKIYSLILDFEDGKLLKEEYLHLINLRIDPMALIEE